MLAPHVAFQGIFSVSIICHTKDKTVFTEKIGAKHYVSWIFTNLEFLEIPFTKY